MKTKLKMRKRLKKRILKLLDKKTQVADSLAAVDLDKQKLLRVMKMINRMTKVMTQMIFVMSKKL